MLEFIVDFLSIEFYDRLFGYLKNNKKSKFIRLLIVLSLFPIPLFLLIISYPNVVAYDQLWAYALLATLVTLNIYSIVKYILGILFGFRDSKKKPSDL